MDPAEQLTDAATAQRFAALGRSKEVRAQNKLLRSALRDRKIDVDRMIRGSLTPPPLAVEVEQIIGRWKIEKLVRSVPGIGSTRANQVIAAGKFSAGARVESLSFERRAELARLVAAARGVSV